MKEFAYEFYHSKQWLKCRDSYISSVHGLCERCLEKGIHKPGKILHHKIYLTPENINDQSITLRFSNLEYLCQDCHNKEHMQTECTAKGLKFDKYGMIVKK